MCIRDMNTIDMTDKRQELKDWLLRAFEICDKHITRIEEALCGLKPYFPLDEEKYLNLNSEAVMRLDQFIFRFSRLQDVIGAKIFRYVPVSYTHLDVYKRQVLAMVAK